MEGKPVSASRVTMTHLVQPTEANPLGSVHGGVIMRLVDEVGAVAAIRHARRPVVTAAVDRLSFRSPVSVGNLLILKASVNFVGRTSMEVGVRVEAEDLPTGQVTHTSSAYLVYVALDDQGRPSPVPPLIPETDEDRRRMAEAEFRRRLRLMKLGHEKEGLSRPPQ
ncbi:MAG: acyl-CoA thioesterase [candidate division NC10 bacterium]|nr:acyl-CoA thioesterase [candidate division NC10 bacterium]